MFKTLRLIEREVSGRNRLYLVRISPYQTSENRISGAALTFIDITENKRAEAEREDLLARERAARIEAETDNRLKDDFLATLPQELRARFNRFVVDSRNSHPRQGGSGSTKAQEGN